MDHWRTALPPSFAIHEVTYEEAVDDLEGVARRLVAAIGLDWNPACLEFHRTRRPSGRPARTRSVKPIYRTLGRPMEALPGRSSPACSRGSMSGGDP